jgi:pyrroline-5-carboxylate reductase
MAQGTFDLVIVGGGNMGAALAEGLLAGGIVAADQLAVAEALGDRRTQLVDLLPGVHVADTVPPNAAAVLAVKPPDVPDAAAAAVAGGARRLLSIAAGVTTRQIERAAGGVTPDPVAVIRAMPNTPALVGQGASAISGGSSATDEDLAWAEAVLGGVGLVVRVAESQLDAVTGLSGSGPAYVFLVAEALIAAAVDVGLDPDLAATLTTQLLVGSAALLAERGDPAALRVMVTSPGGTTAAGLRVLDEREVRNAFREAVAAATARSRELSPDH